MSNKILSLQLMPSYRLTAEGMGFDIDTMDVEANNEAIQYQQGLGIVDIIIQPGEEFEIPAIFEEGTVSCEEISYTLRAKNFDDELETLVENEDTITLEPGRYLFSNDGVSIVRLYSFGTDITGDEGEL